MTRSIEVYPKAFLRDSIWRAVVKVDRSRFEHFAAAGVTADPAVQLLKVVFFVTVEDTDTDQDVDDALFVDDIHPAPGTEETVASNWIVRAEGIISGLDPGYTVDDFWAAWTQGDTQAVRNDVLRAFETGPAGGRGWTITRFHQHEGTGPPWVTEG